MESLKFPQEPNISKCVVSLKGVCDIKCNDLITETIKHVDVHFSYNQKLQIYKNFLKNICNMKNLLNLWKMRNIALEGTLFFKILALSKIV